MPSTSPSPSPSVPRVFPLSSDYLLRVSRTSDATVFFEDSRPHSPNSLNSPTTGATVAICLPGIGDTRRQFRLLAPLLHYRLGWRVLLGDLRGFGDSTGRFEEATINDKSDSYPTFSPESVAADVTQLMTELHTEDPTTRFVLLGNSLAAGSMVLAAVHARASALNGHIRGLVLLGPVLRDAPMVAAVFRVVAPVLFNSLWGNGIWTWYYRSLYPVRQPSDLDSEIDILRKHLKDNRRGITNTRYFMNARKDAVESAVAKLAPEVAVVAFLGRKDPDYPDADKEGEWIKSVVAHATVSMEDDCGHYPHLEDPEKVFAAIAKAMG